MAYQYIIIGPGPKQVYGTNSASDALSYQKLTAFTVIDATNQNILTLTYGAGAGAGQPVTGTSAIPLATVGGIGISN